jgi:DNA replication and repair protein RecF
VLVTHVVLADFRLYRWQELELAPGLTAVVGPNGAGKTSLLEGIHVGTQGHSLRTRRDARAIRFGAVAGRAVAEGTCGEGRRFRTRVTITPAGKELVLDGAVLAGAESLQQLLPVLAFTPDRLAVVKGGPVVRRTYLDRTVGRLSPSLAGLPAEFARALSQRNAALRQARAGMGSREAVEPWTEAVALLGARLDAARERVVERLAPRFTARASALGLEAAALTYAASGVTATRLEERLGLDLERGTTGIGPHLCELGISADGRELRVYGSQGEQRLALLALLLGEADTIAGERGEQPLLLLDDVLSELDERRRAALLDGLPEGGQALVTATTLQSLPKTGSQPKLVVDVAGGRAVAR